MEADPPVAQTYDYIIVGAGSAGCVLAYRLSESPRASVLLIEAGPRDTSPHVHRLRGYLRTHREPGLRWSLPVTANAERGEWRGSFIGGKVLGGTSSINAMVYARGHAADYDEWADSGAPGWSWQDLLPCFRSIEDHELGGSAMRGAGGPLHISLRRPSALSEAVIQAGVSVGLPYREDLNDHGGEGIAYSQATIRNGRRLSSARAFLTPIAGRPNLTVRTDTVVTRVVFDGTRAIGVACTTNAGPREFRAGKEVVVCAGALQSPKILQLSGIGPAQRLRALNVPVIHDSPGVGANLLDHWSLRLRHRLLPAGDPTRRLRSVGLRGRALRFLVRRTGAFWSTGPTVVAFIGGRRDGRRPDGELMISPFAVTPRSGDPGWEPRLQCAVIPLRLEGRGSVMIRSPDPEVAPEIRADFLSTDADRRLMVDLVRYARRLLHQPPLPGFLAEETFPGPACRSDEEIVEASRRSGDPASHFAGTCRIGQDRMAVLDERVRVRGVTGLRVVDGSIMPTLVSCNTNGPIMALAWRAADLILGTD